MIHLFVSLCFSTFAGGIFYSWKEKKILQFFFVLAYQSGNVKMMILLLGMMGWRCLKKILNSVDQLLMSGTMLRALD